MDLYSIVILVVLALSIGLVLKLVKGVVKIISFIFLILFVVSIVLGFFVYKDMDDLRKNWPDSDKIILLANDKVYSGMIATFSGGKEPVFIDNLENYQSDYASGNYDLLLGSNYKLFIFRIGMFERTDEKIDFEGMEIYGKEVSLSKSEILDIIESDNSAEKFVSIVISNGEMASAEKQAFKDELVREIGSGNELKGAMFGILFQNAVEKDPLFLFKNLNNGNVIIYPETVIFKLLKIAPLSLMEGIMQKAMGVVR